jgi:hypothetical protein
VGIHHEGPQAASPLPRHHRQASSRWFVPPSAHLHTWHPQMCGHGGLQAMHDSNRPPGEVGRDSGPPVEDASPFRSIAVALQYLTFTRPDITYAVQQICLHMHDPWEPHLTAMKRILCYLQGTLDYGLLLHHSSSSDLIVYTEADWAGCLDTHRSTSGYVVFLGDNLVSWSAKRQIVISRSSAEAEYRAIANSMAEATWLHQLLHELQTPPSQCTLVYCDNISVVYLSTNPFSINAPSMPERRLPSVKSTSSMSRRHRSSPTSSRRGSPPWCLINFGPVSTSADAEL